MSDLLPGSGLPIPQDVLSQVFVNVQPIYARAISNEYCQCSACRPWLMVTTSVGHFKVGWRKRVLVVDWSLTDVTATAAELFPEEDTTKDGRSIHAWGYDKARGYVERILKPCIKETE